MALASCGKEEDKAGGRGTGREEGEGEMLQSLTRLQTYYWRHFCRNSPRYDGQELFKAKCPGALKSSRATPIRKQTERQAHIMYLIAAGISATASHAVANSEAITRGRERRGEGRPRKRRKGRRTITLPETEGQLASEPRQLTGPINPKRLQQEVFVNDVRGGTVARGTNKNVKKGDARPQTGKFPDLP